MLKNKKMIGLLVGVCILLCTIVVLTTTSTKLKESPTPNTTTVEDSVDKDDSGETSSESKEQATKEETKTDSSNTEKPKSDVSDKKDTQTSSKENNSSTQNSNQSQNSTETDKPSTPEGTTQHVYVSIDCRTILNNMNDLPEKYKQYVPSNGIILSSKKMKINEGDTVFDVTMKIPKMYKNKIKITHLSGYINSINNLEEKIFKGSGGWMYSVNGNYADRGSTEYKLKNGDKVEWRYTCYIGDLK